MGPSAAPGTVAAQHPLDLEQPPEEVARAELGLELGDCVHELRLLA